MQEIFEENISKKLRGAINWIPMLVSDSLDSANERKVWFSDPRVWQYWDQDRNSGQLLSQTLKLKMSIAWDVCLVYPAVHSWNTELPPEPEVWMHQLDDEESACFLNPHHLKHYVKTLLERIYLQ